MLITQFYSRKIFLRYLDLEYLGINGLFSNVLSVLSFAELGIGSAVIYNLYQAVAENDTDKTSRLLNYYRKAYMIIMAVVMAIAAFIKLINKFFQPLTASVGNLCAVEKKEKAYEIFQVISFINFWIKSFISVGLVSCMDMLIKVWLGKQYVLPDTVVFLICLNFYLKCMRETLIIFKDANGLYWEERYKGIAEAAVNLVASLILARYLGLTGILLGTTISTVTTVLWIEPYVLFRNYFKGYSLRPYFIRYTVQFITTSVLSAACLWINGILFGHVSIRNLAGRILLCTLLVNGIYLIAFRKTPEFEFIKNIMKNWLERIRKPYGQEI